MSEFAVAIKEIGINAVASACGCSHVAVYKWIKNGGFPRTEYTGETDYSARLERLSDGKFTRDFLLKCGAKPRTPPHATHD